MKKLIMILVSIFMAVRPYAQDPLPQDPTKPKEEVETEKLTREEKKEIVEEQQEASGKGSSPVLPPRESTLKRSVIMFLVTLVTAVVGIAAVGSNPGRGAPPS